MLDLDKLPPEVTEQITIDARNDVLKEALQTIATAEMLHFTLRGIGMQTDGELPKLDKVSKVIGLLATAQVCIKVADACVCGTDNLEIDAVLEKQLLALIAALKRDNESRAKVAQAKTQDVH